MRQKTLALYIRLSKEDDDVGISSEKEESNSITNQRMLLYDYLKSHTEFQDYRIIEKCDDGYSGKKFDRPQFVELMELVRQREVDCILVKDLSRIGRSVLCLANRTRAVSRVPCFRVRAAVKQPVFSAHP